MPVGRVVDPTTFNQTTVSRLLEIDQMLNSPGLANLIQFFDARNVDGIKASVPGVSDSAEDDTQLDRMRGAVLKVKEIRDSWNDPNTGGRPLMRFFSGLG